MKQTLLAISAALIGAGNGLSAFANGANQLTPESGATPVAPTSDGGAEPPKRGRGRPAAAAAETPAADPAPAAPADDAGRFEANRALIKPLVEASQGEEVKKVIAKYSKTGLKDIPAASQADFEKDIAALSY